MPNEQSLSQEINAFLIRVLEQSSRPLSKTTLEKNLPKSAPVAKKDLPELLAQLIGSGQIRTHGKRATVYWVPELEDRAGDRILETLRDTPLTQTELKNKFRSLLPGWPQTKREEMLARLIREKRVYRVAPLTGKARLLSARAELTPQDYVRLALQLAAGKLKSRGFTAEEVFALARELSQPVPIAAEPVAPAPVVSPLAPSPLAESNLVTPVLEEVVLEQMNRIKPDAANGALVSIAELRRALAGEMPDKSAFDEAILRLAEAGRVALHHHDYPGSLSQEERDALVLDERGNYYIGIALRV